MVKLALKYAIICGVFLIIIFHVSDYFGIHPLINIAHLFFDLGILALFTFFAMKEYKSDQPDNVFHFWHGMSIGFMIYTISTLVFIASLFVYFQINMNALVDYQEAAKGFLLEKESVYTERIGVEMFQDQLVAIENVTVDDLVLSSGLKKILAGFFVTPIISVILRKQPK